MKNSIYIIIIFLACVTLACDDKTEDFKGPYSLVVTGPTSVAPGASKTYRLAPYSKPETYTWTVDGPAQIVGATTGLVVKVKFASVGKVTLTVTNGSDKEIIPITVGKVEPVVDVTLNGTGVLKDSKADTVFLSFPAPLVSKPTIAMLASTDSSQFVPGTLAFHSGNLDPVLHQVDPSHYYVIYTPGIGNGTPEAIIKGMTSTTDFGSVTVDTAYIQLYRVDNIAPIAALSYSPLKANDGTVVTVTATFSEAMTFEDPLDSAILISFSGTGVTPETDTLMATDNPLVYTYDYTVNGGDGAVTVALSNAVDLGGNDIATTTNTTGLIVDNIAPLIQDGLASDGGDYASLKIKSSETGTVWYLILKNGTDPAPVRVEDFSGGAASGSAHVIAGTQITKANILAEGSYTVYFISQDEAGNYSPIISTPLVMN